MINCYWQYWVITKLFGNQVRGLFLELSLLFGKPQPSCLWHKALWKHSLQNLLFTLPLPILVYFPILQLFSWYPSLLILITSSFYTCLWKSDHHLHLQLSVFSLSHYETIPPNHSENEPALPSFRSPIPICNMSQVKVSNCSVNMFFSMI